MKANRLARFKVVGDILSNDQIMDLKIGRFWNVGQPHSPFKTEDERRSAWRQYGRMLMANRPGEFFQAHFEYDKPGEAKHRDFSSIIDSMKGRQL